MILSVSRRTDIPAWYSEWFFRRLQEGFVLVRHPMNYYLVNRVALNPDVVDGIVFWTKNPAPMLDRLGELADYPCYFQVTLNAYGREVEPNVPSKSSVVLPAFQELSRRLGRERVLWRYDPIFLSQKYTVDYHCRYFERLVQRLHPYTELCTISFIDYYRGTRKRLEPLGEREIPRGEVLELAGRMAQIAARYGLELCTCAEEIDLDHLGIGHGCCIDSRRMERIAGERLNIGYAASRRPACGCVEAVDIGMYNTCRGACLYCYANHNPERIGQRFEAHRPDSPLLGGPLTPEDRIVDREIRSCRDGQMRLF